MLPGSSVIRGAESHNQTLRPLNTVSHAAINNLTLCRPYIGVVLWRGVGFGCIQRYDEQTALDGLQDGLIVRINAY